MGNQTKQIYRFRGLNLKTNELLKPEGFATIVDNVELTQEGYLTKRDGFKEMVVNQDNVDNIFHFDSVGIIQYMEVSGQFTVTNRRAVLGLKSDGIYGWDEIFEVWLKFDWVGGFDSAVPVWTEPTSWVENDGILYMADPSGVNEIMKVDPTSPMMYRAGLPVPDITSIGVAGATHVDLFVRVVFEHFDGQGNVIQGDYFEAGPLTSDSLNITLNTLKTTQFYGSSTNSVSMKTYVSLNPTFGYRAAFDPIPSAVDSTNLTQIINIDAANLNAALSPTSTRELLTDVYDYTIRKGLPPKAKYLTLYNGLMVAGDYSSVKASDTNLIGWSDLSTGGSAEAFPALNQQRLGQSDEAVTGLFGDSDNLIVLKERNVFYLSGDLISGNYRVRDSLSEGIGCIAHLSIIKVQGGAIFLSERGIYGAFGGNKPQEFSDIIQPLFTDVLPATMQFAKAVSVLDRLREKIYIFIPSSIPAESIVLQYDYYFKEWFLYSGINAAGGFSMFQDNLVHTDGVKAFERQAAKNDDGAAISATYGTTWMNLDAPSVKKKYTNFLAFSLDESTWKLSVTTQKNWKDIDLNTAIMQFPASGGSEDTSLPSDQAHSMRFKMENAVIEENILINGYEYEYAYTQTRFKGDD